MSAGGVHFFFVLLLLPHCRLRTTSLSFCLNSSLISGHVDDGVYDDPMASLMTSEIEGYIVGLLFFAAMETGSSCG